MQHMSLRLIWTIAETPTISAKYTSIYELKNEYGTAGGRMLILIVLRHI